MPKYLLIIVLILGAVMARGSAQSSPSGYTPACLYPAPISQTQYTNPCPFAVSLAIGMHPGTVLGTIHKALLGENLNTWRQSSAEHQVIGQIYASGARGSNTLGVTSIRWPGGSSANGVNWQDYTAAPNNVPNYGNAGLMSLQCTGIGTTGEYPQEPTGDLTSAMNNIVTADGMTMFIGVSYGQYSAPGTRSQTCNTVGSPSYAAQELTYAYSQGWNVPLMEIGNEEYGNDAQDNHTVANGYPYGPGSGFTYASQEPPFYTALHAAAATAGKSLGVCIGMIGFKSSAHNNFDQNMLANLPGSDFDCVDYHHYPMPGPGLNLLTDANIIASPVYGSQYQGALFMPGVAAGIQVVRNELIQYGVCSSPCTSYPIYVGEWNIIGGAPPVATNTIVQFLFNVEMLGEMSTANVAGAYQWETLGCYAGNTALSPNSLFGQYATEYGWQQDFASSGPITSVIPAPVATATALGAASLGLNSSQTNCTGAYGLKETIPFGTILPDGRAFQMLSQSGFATEGASSVAMDNTYPGLRSYGSVSSGKYVGVYVNTNAFTPINVTATIDGVSGSSGYSTITYSKAIYDQSANNGPFNPPIYATGGPWTTSIPITVPPWGAVTLTVNTP